MLTCVVHFPCRRPTAPPTSRMRSSSSCPSWRFLTSRGRLTPRSSDHTMSPPPSSALQLRPCSRTRSQPITDTSLKLYKITVSVFTLFSSSGQNQFHAWEEKVCSCQTVLSNLCFAGLFVKHITRTRCNTRCCGRETKCIMINKVQFMVLLFQHLHFLLAEPVVWILPQRTIDL